MDLLLIRHARPLRVDGCDGPADPCLAPEGHEQTRALAAWLAQEPIDVVYSSPLARARQTAAPVAERSDVEVFVDDGLAEFDRRATFYVPVEDLRADGDSRWRDVLAGHWNAFGEADPEAFQRRVVTTVERVIDAHPGATVAVVAHGGVINAYVAHVLGTASMLFFEPSYTSVTRVVAARTGERTIRSLNETAHLQRSAVDA